MAASEIARRFQLALDLYQAGEDMMRAKLRREFPHDTDEEIERRLIAWLSERPGAEHGDCPGTLRPLPEDPA